MKATKHYLVQYYGHYYFKTVFVTDNEFTAINYTQKFNGILKHWKDYYKQFEDTNYDWISDEHIDKFDRWHSLRNITKCTYEEIEFR